MLPGPPQGRFPACGGGGQVLVSGAGCRFDGRVHRVQGCLVLLPSEGDVDVLGLVAVGVKSGLQGVGYDYCFNGGAAAGTQRFSQDVSSPDGLPADVAQVHGVFRARRGPAPLQDDGVLDVQFPGQESGRPSLCFLLIVPALLAQAPVEHSLAGQPGCRRGKPSIMRPGCGRLIIQAERGSDASSNRVGCSRPSMPQAGRVVQRFPKFIEG